MKYFNNFDQKFTILILGIFLAIFTLTSCSPVGAPIPVVVETKQPTSTNTPTATIEWFPATATPTMPPIRQTSPTPDFRLNVGDILLSDDFSEPGEWTLSRSSLGSIALGVNELTIAISEPGAYLNSIRQEPDLGDYYLEVTTNPTLCRGEDQYGLLLRISSPSDFYRYSLSCDGRIRLDRIVGGTASSPQPWTTSTATPPGAPIPSRLGVWLKGDQMRFFVNDQYQFTVVDPLLSSGFIGLFAWSAGDTAVTVNFTDLVVYQIYQ